MTKDYTVITINKMINRIYIYKCTNKWIFNIKISKRQSNSFIHLTDANGFFAHVTIVITIKIKIKILIFKVNRGFF